MNARRRRQIAAVLNCCCVSASKTSPVAGGNLIACCPGIVLPNTIHATMHSVALNGTFALNWYEANVLTGGSVGVSAWYSDWIFQFRCGPPFYFDIYNFWSALVWYPGCVFQWVQYPISLNAGGGPPPIGAVGSANVGYLGGPPFPGNGCTISHSCDPFYSRLGLGGSGGGIPIVGCAGLPEPPSDCTVIQPHTNGANVELSL